MTRKWFLKYGIHICIWSSLVIYLLSFNGLYTKYFVKVGKPVWVGTIDQVESDMVYAFDSLDEVIYDGEYVYQLVGYAFPRNAFIELATSDKQIVILDDELKAYVFDAQMMPRPGLTEAFIDMNMDLYSAGFKAQIARGLLLPGIYKIAILYTEQTSTRIYKVTNNCIHRTPNTMSLIECPSIAREPTWLGVLNNVESEVFYSIDSIDVDLYNGEEVIHIIGWAFPRNTDLPLENYEKQIVFLDEERNAFVFDVETMPRPGLTEAFSEMYKDLYSAGFEVHMSKDALDHGIYKIGFLFSDQVSSNVYFLTNTCIFHSQTTSHIEEICSDGN